MGTAARKARKREHHAALDTLASADPNSAAYRRARTLVAETPFVHPRKTPTPFFDRALFHLIRNPKTGKARESAKARSIRAALKKAAVKKQEAGQ